MEIKQLRALFFISHESVILRILSSFYFRFRLHNTFLLVIISQDSGFYVDVENEFKNVER